MLGIAEEYEHFDADIIMHINTVFMILTQMGVGPEEGFTIEDDLATWSDFIEDDVKFYEGLKSYMVLKVRVLFDPPTSSAVMEATNRMIDELEWRLRTAYIHQNSGGNSK